MENFARTSHYISELLYDHDCVIVPQFGGFVCTYVPAKIHPGQHIFNPPSKQVFFNRHLQNNDGLLTDSIASSGPCTFEEAKKDVESFVSAIKTEFAAGNKVELPHLGTMHLDPEGNIPKYNLQYLRYYHDLEVDDATAHSALGDVRVLMVLFERYFTQMLTSIGDETAVLQEMVRVSGEPILLRRFNFGKYAGLEVKQVAHDDPGYLAWLLNQKIMARERGEENDENWIYTLDTYVGK